MDSSHSAKHTPGSGQNNTPESQLPQQATPNHQYSLNRTIELLTRTNPLKPNHYTELTGSFTELWQQPATLQKKEIRTQHLHITASWYLNLLEEFKKKLSVDRDSITSDDYDTQKSRSKALLKKTQELWSYCINQITPFNSVRLNFADQSPTLNQKEAPLPIRPPQAFQECIDGFNRGQNHGDAFNNSTANAKQIITTLQADFSTTLNAFTTSINAAESIDELSSCLTGQISTYTELEATHAGPGLDHRQRMVTVEENNTATRQAVANAMRFSSPNQASLTASTTPGTKNPNRFLSYTVPTHNISEVISGGKTPLALVLSCNIDDAEQGKRAAFLIDEFGADIETLEPTQTQKLNQSLIQAQDWYNAELAESGPLNQKLKDLNQQLAFSKKIDQVFKPILKHLHAEIAVTKTKRYNQFNLLEDKLQLIYSAKNALEASTNIEKNLTALKKDLGQLRRGFWHNRTLGMVNAITTESFSMRKKRSNYPTKTSATNAPITPPRSPQEPTHTSITHTDNFTTPPPKNTKPTRNEINPSSTEGLANNINKMRARLDNVTVKIDKLENKLTTKKRARLANDLLSILITYLTKKRNAYEERSTDYKMLDSKLKAVDQLKEDLMNDEVTNLGIRIENLEEALNQKRPSLFSCFVKHTESQSYLEKVKFSFQRNFTLFSQLNKKPIADTTTTPRSSQN